MCWTVRVLNPDEHKRLSPKVSRTAMGSTQLAVQSVPAFCTGVKTDGVKLTAHLHLVPRLRMSGAVPLLPLHAFMVWTRITLPLILSSRRRHNHHHHLHNHHQMAESFHSSIPG